MNLPRLDARLTTKPQGSCGNGTNSTALVPPYVVNRTTELTDSLPNIGPLVLVEANVSVTVDTGFGVELPLLTGSVGNFSVEANLFSTSFPLVTACATLQDAYKDLKPIVAAPPSTTYRNATITASQMPIATPYPPYANNTVTIPPYANTTVVITKTTKIHRHTSIVTPLPESQSGPPTKEPFYPVETYVSIAPYPLVPASSKLVHSISSLQVNTTIPSPTLCANTSSTTTTTSAIIGVSSLPPLLPSGTVIMSSGFLSPSNATYVGMRQTSLPTFTGSASSAAEVPAFKWREAWWRVGVFGGSLLFGVVLL